MISQLSVLSFTAIFAVAKGHAVIFNAQGEDGSPPSVGFQGGQLKRLGLLSMAAELTLVFS